MKKTGQAQSLDSFVYILLAMVVLIFVGIGVLFIGNIVGGVLFIVFGIAIVILYFILTSDIT